MQSLCVDTVVECMRLFLSLCLSLCLVLLVGCSEQQPIQRGIKYLGDGVKSHFERTPEETPTAEAAHTDVAEQTADTAKQVAAVDAEQPMSSLSELTVPSVEVLRRETDWYRFQEQSRQPLNLSLPEDWQWHDDVLMTEHQTFPNVFKRAPLEDRFSLSGRLHIDETDESYELPTIELLQGAEVELIFRTR